MQDETETFKKNNQLDAYNRFVAIMSERLTQWKLPERWTILPRFPPKELVPITSPDNFSIEKSLNLVTSFIREVMPEFRLMTIGSLMHISLIITIQLILINEHSMSDTAKVTMILTLIMAPVVLTVGIYSSCFNQNLASRASYHIGMYVSHLVLLTLLIVNLLTRPMVPMFLKVVAVRTLACIPLVDGKNALVGSLTRLISDVGLMAIALATAESEHKNPFTYFMGSLLFCGSYFVSFVLELGLCQRFRRGFEILEPLVEVMLKQLSANFYLGTLPKFTLIVDRESVSRKRSPLRKHSKVRIHEYAKSRAVDDVGPTNLGQLYSVPNVAE